MKKRIFFFVAMFVYSAFGYGQTDVSGSWKGVLKVGGLPLRLVLNIEGVPGNYTATLDSPDQGAMGMPVTWVTFEKDTLRFAATQLGASYEGVLAEGEVKGTFKQRGMTFPLDITRKNGEDDIKFSRPQEPKEPFPYKTEQVTFENKKAGIRLAGTLSLPAGKGPFPAVVLVSGSGPQDRDSNLFGHKPFLVLSDYLTRNGVAVLRYDDRGTAESEGDFSAATTVDFSEDAEAAFDYLKARKETIDDRTGIVGHSEGGIIAPMVASRRADVGFIVMLAGVGIKGSELLLQQQEEIAWASGVSPVNVKIAKTINRGIFEVAEKAEGKTELRKGLLDYAKKNPLAIPQGGTAETFASQHTKTLGSPWMMGFLRHEPSVYLKKVNCPVLAVFGGKDLQVPAKKNLEAMKAALKEAGNTKVGFKVLPGLNHLFQECEKGLPAEYPTIKQTISPALMMGLANWILKRAQ
ncbi:alpha/beta hydrolase family protein [Fulvitalea axinellae]